jgi:phytoene/squalene synthetase
MERRPSSRWREFIEARDSLLAVLTLPCLPSELLKRGKWLAEKLRERTRIRQPQRCRILTVAWA